MATNKMLNFLLVSVREHLGSPSQDQCLIWPHGRNKNGYGKLKISGRDCVAHRVAYSAFIRPLEGNCALHRCDNPSCFNPLHIFPGTNRDNQIDKFLKGRQARGEKHGRSKLTEEQVKEIRRDYVFGSSDRNQVHFAKKFGVTQRVIQLVVSNRGWRHIQNCDGSPE